MKRALRTIGRALVVVVGSVAIVAAVAVLRLMSGPIELEFLHDRAQRELETVGGTVRVTSGKVLLDWPGITHPIRLIAQDIKAVDPAGVMLASAPSIALTFDARSVLAGNFAPTTVVILGPTVDADMRKGGVLRPLHNQADAQPEARVAALVIDQLLAQPNSDNLLGQLDTVVVENAHLTLRDSTTGLSWTAPNARAELKRDVGGVVVNANAQFTGAAGVPIVASVKGTYSRDRSHISFESRLEGVNLSQFSGLSPDTAILRGIDLPLTAVLQVEANGSGEIQGVTAELTGTNGRISLPGVLPVTHTMRSLQAKVVFDRMSDSIKTARVTADLGEARFEFNGTGVIKSGDLTFAGKAAFDGIPVDRIADYWPIKFAPGGREWAARNVSGGQADIAAEFALTGKLGALEDMSLDKAVANLSYRDLVVRYMPEMPPVEAVHGTARYEQDNLRFNVASGRSGPLTVAGGTIEMLALSSPGPQYASIRIPVTATAGAVMEFLARPRLGLPRDLLYDPKRVTGDAVIEVSLNFPMVNSLTLAELDVKAEADMTSFGLRDAIGKADLTDGKAHVSYSGSDLRVSGTAKLEGHNLDISWREQFGPKVTYRRRYEAKGTVPVSLLPKAGLPDLEPAISGPVAMDVVYQVAANGTSEVQGRFNLKAAKGALPQAGWTKEAGADGQTTATIRLGANGKLTTMDFDARAAGLATKGQARFTGDNALQQVTLQSFTLGRSDFSAEWRRAANGMEVAVRGRALEWSRVRSFLRQRDANDAKAPAAATGAAPATPAAPSMRVAVSVALDQVLMERGSLGGMTGSLEIVGDRVNFADLSLPAAGGSTFRIAPSGQGRTVKVNVNNVGQVLKSAGWLDGLAGGWLAFDGRFDDSKSVAPLAGKFSMGQFRMEKVAPRPNVGSLNGTIESLSAAGDPHQLYEVLEAEVVKTGDVISIRKGRTNGRSIGLTTRGTIDLGKEMISLRGLVVPSYALNNALSNVPLLGPLLTGGKDGGVFAVTYRVEGPLDDPKSSRNIMSAITPGALRELFNNDGERPDVDLPTEGTRAP